MPEPRVSDPQVSLVLLVYNQAALLRPAVQACFDQEGEPIEIVLSDDASTDGSFEILQAMAAGYRGPHQVRVRRNARNLGIGGHYNALLDDTRGELIVTAAGDDVSLPHRVQALRAAWQADGCKADLLSSHYAEMAPDGRLGRTVGTDDLTGLTVQDWLRRRPFVVGATHAFTRRMMRHFGPFIDGVWYEDAVMTFRALCLGGAVTVPQALVQYRVDGSSARPADAQLTVARQRAWVQRQNGRLLAEMRQLQQDADRAGCGEALREAQLIAWQRASLIDALAKGAQGGARWQALRAADRLPWAWRLRKALWFAWPAASALSVAWRRWRARLRGR